MLSLPVRQIVDARAQEQPNDHHTPTVENYHRHFPQQNSAIRDATCQQRFQGMPFALAGKGIGNDRDDDEKGEPEENHQLNRTQVHPGVFAQQWLNDAQNADQDYRANPGIPAALKERVLPFLPHDRQYIAHQRSSSISVKKTSSRLAAPLRTSSTSAPCRTIRLTSGPTSLSPRSPRIRCPFCTSALATSGRSRSSASRSSLKPRPTISTCWPPCLKRSASGLPSASNLPLRMTPTSAQSRSASTRLWVLRKTVAPSRFTNVARSSRSAAAATGSKPEVGSSRKISVG